jgi:hypothetical protein
MRHANKVLGMVVAVMLPLSAYAPAYFLRPNRWDSTIYSKGTNAPALVLYCSTPLEKAIYTPLAKCEGYLRGMRVVMQSSEPFSSDVVRER